MIIFQKKKISAQDEKRLRRFFVDKKIDVIPVRRRGQTLYVVLGRFGRLTLRDIKTHKLVDYVLEVNKQYKLTAKSKKFNKTIIQVNGNKIGNKKICLMAGPCTVETKAQIFEIAKKVKSAGCHFLRGGAFKPRTAPYGFQGHGKIGLHFLKEAAKANKLGVITEVLDVRDIALVEKYTDIFQVGTRNMQNYPLLRELGKTRKPVLLKRGMWATYKEFLLAAEYILIGGNSKVILCERGIRTSVPETRFTLDLNAVPYLKKESHLPVIVDPSHGTGKASLVRAMSKASIAAGADGLLIEAHTNPRKSISDADQAISPEELKKIVRDVKKIAKAIGRE